MSEHPDVPGLQPDPESAEAVGRGGGGHVSSDGSVHDMGGDIGPADEAVDPTKLPDRPELDS